MQITVTFESLEEFQKYFSQKAEPAAAKQPKAKTPAKPAPEPIQEAEPVSEELAPEAPAPAPQEKITKTDVRAVALKLSKAGKSKELKAIFSEFGAEKLSDIKEEDYPALMAKLGAVDA